MPDYTERYLYEFEARGVESIIGRFNEVVEASNVLVTRLTETDTRVNEIMASITRALRSVGGDDVAAGFQSVVAQANQMVSGLEQAAARAQEALSRLNVQTAAQSSSAPPIGTYSVDYNPVTGQWYRVVGGRPAGFASRAEVKAAGFSWESPPGTPGRSLGAAALGFSGPIGVYEEEIERLMGASPEERMKLLWGLEATGMPPSGGEYKVYPTRYTELPGGRVTRGFGLYDVFEDAAGDIQRNLVAELVQEFDAQERLLRSTVNARNILEPGVIENIRAAADIDLPTVDLAQAERRRTLLRTRRGNVVEQAFDLFEPGTDRKVGQLTEKFDESGKAVERMIYNMQTGEKVVEQFGRAADTTAAQWQRHLTWIGQAALFYAVFNAIEGTINTWVDAHRQLDYQLAAFRANLGGTAEEARRYQDTLMAISRETGVSIESVGAAQMLAMRTRADPNIGRYAAQIEMAFGMPAGEAAREIISLSRQFPEMETIEILNALAGAYKSTSLSIEEFFGLLETSGSLTREYNGSLRETLAILGGISTITGEPAGGTERLARKLPEMYTDTETARLVERITGRPTVTYDYEGRETRRPMFDILRDISQRATDEQIIELAQRFGSGLNPADPQYFEQVIRSFQTVEQILATTKAPNEFQNQVAEMADRFETDVSRMKQSWALFLSTLGDTKEVRVVVQIITQQLNQVAEQIAQSGKQGLPSTVGIATSSDLFSNIIRTALLQVLLPPGVGSFAGVASTAYSAYEQLSGDAGDRSLERLKSVAGLVGAIRERARSTQLPQQSVLLPPDMVEPQGTIASPFNYAYNNLSLGIPGFSSVSYLPMPIAGTRATVAPTAAQVYLPTVISAPSAAYESPPMSRQVFPVYEPPERYRAMPGKTLELPAGVDINALRTAYTEWEAAMRDSAAQYGMSAATYIEATTETVAVVNDQNVVVGELTGSMIGLKAAADAAAASLPQLAAMMEEVTPERLGRVSDYAARYDEMMRQAGLGYMLQYLPGGGVVAGENMQYGTIGGVSRQGISFGASQVEKEDAAREAAARRAEAEARRLAREQEQAQKRILSAIEGFTNKLLTPTQVTQEDVEMTEAGVYEDKFDEPIRRARDAARRRMRGLGGAQLGDWADYARGIGIDLESKAGAARSLADLERRFYSGRTPELYNWELAARQYDEYIAEQQGRKQFVNMFLENYEKVTGKKADRAEAMAALGIEAPVVGLLTGGLPTTEVSEQLKPVGEAVGGGIASGVQSVFKETNFVEVYVSAWRDQVSNEKNVESVVRVGRQLGTMITDGMGDSIAENILPVIIASITSAIQAAQGGS